MRDNGTATCFNEEFYTDLLSGQLAAERFPDRVIPANYSRDYREYDDEDVVTHSLHIWDNRDNDLGIHLRPGYELDKVRKDL